MSYSLLFKVIELIFLTSNVTLSPQFSPVHHSLAHHQAHILATKNPVISTPVPTNVITGFLGVGKTTLIRQLLDRKPAQEKWAILVNEFGEIGIDGAFFSGRDNKEIFVREVPGGCMCCTSGLPMQIALNQLLALAKPDRLLIEPTGLGHPKEVLDTLREAHYADVLALQATLTLVDARVVTDTRYAENETFQQQLEVADYILAAKSDLYSPQNRAELDGYLERLGLSHTPVKNIVQGQVDMDILARPLKPADDHGHHHHEHHHHHHQDDDPLDVEDALRQSGEFRTQQDNGEFYTHSWAFSPDKVFRYDSIIAALERMRIERLKAVFITERGIFAFNKVDTSLDTFELDESQDSRLEIIASDREAAERVHQQLESSLFS